MTRRPCIVLLAVHKSWSCSWLMVPIVIGFFATESLCIRPLRVSYPSGLLRCACFWRMVLNLHLRLEGWASGTRMFAVPVGSATNTIVAPFSLRSMDDESIFDELRRHGAMKPSVWGCGLVSGILCALALPCGGPVCKSCCCLSCSLCAAYCCVSCMHAARRPRVDVVAEHQRWMRIMEALQEPSDDSPLRVELPPASLSIPVLRVARPVPATRNEWCCLLRRGNH